MARKSQVLMKWCYWSKIPSTAYGCTSNNVLLLSGELLLIGFFLPDITVSKIVFDSQEEQDLFISITRTKSAVDSAIIDNGGLIEIILQLEWPNLGKSHTLEINFFLNTSIISKQGNLAACSPDELEHRPLRVVDNTSQHGTQNKSLLQWGVREL